MNILYLLGMMFPLPLMIATLVLLPKTLFRKTQFLTLTVQKCLFWEREMAQFMHTISLQALMYPPHPLLTTLVLPLKKIPLKDQHLIMMARKCLLQEVVEEMLMNILWLARLIQQRHLLSIVLILVLKILYPMVQYLTAMELKCLLLAIKVMILTNIRSLLVSMYPLLPLLETLASLRKILLRGV